ncbi:CinA family protein [Halorubrum halodurans]|uniref:Damage-inducible protein CinA n=1 Tax=Halorubrum halodurans TaxID=1383851 RepID=A0A256IHM2_9EURY|nr:CinA family protein [Halorubrum halodurans]OYR56025.1 damage-inducible protein CinA [Halorubrum halodurans]
MTDDQTADGDRPRDGRSGTRGGAPEALLGELLTDRGETLATAESLTGGLVGSTVTDVPGSSAYFDRGYVTYAYDAKREELGVARETLDEHGAVSGPVAREMAAGARDHADATWGVSTTGIAGPDGGTAEKPVGLVYVGVAYAAPWGTEASFTRSVRAEFSGGRDAVKRASVERALDELVRAIREVDREE